MTATVHKIETKTHRSVVVETDEVCQLKAELEALKSKISQPRESATEIAARLRAGKPPKRHLVFRETIDG